ncbi:sn-glycerol-3-phosphate ABC transporter substrate-binding protein UgpB [Roseobacter sp. MH60115]|uniref:sn-glycerol-3-phosphate ABC transporter substrate-binding protein UgpB n=1 Tax=Roseobacter sp. MH60115 TaxID=2785324 RepID=UPI0018A2C082|nr:sn-glycerol-3-phosphate ABC transporter substrate-binding protein UgpB [Roseobacter sp. MH60115]
MEFPVKSNGVILAAAFFWSTISPVAAQTEITFWHAFSGGLAELLSTQVDAFNASQDDVVVVATRKGDYAETFRAGIEAFGTEDHPSLLMVHDVATAGMVSTPRAFKPLHEVMALQDPDFTGDAFLPGIRGSFSQGDGRILSLPFNTSTPVLWVNRDALTAAGIDPEVDLSTWEQVDEVLGLLRAAGNDCPLTTTWPSWIHLENFSAYHDVPFATSANGFGDAEAALVLNGAAQVAHIDALGAWAQEGKFIYSGRRNAAGARFRAGECALLTESSAAYMSIRVHADFDLDVRPLPYWAALTETPRNSIVGGASIWVMAGQTEVEYQAAAAFLGYMSAAEVQANWHQNTGFLPIARSAVALARARGFYLTNPGSEVAVAQVSADAVTDNSRGLRLHALDQLRGIINEELEAVWSGENDAQAALDSAQSRGEAVLRRYHQVTR